MQNKTLARADIIQTVQTPLGFFTLVVLVVEVILGITANFSQGTDRTFLIVGMLSLIFLLIAIVSSFAFFRPEALTGARPSQRKKAIRHYVLFWWRRESDWAAVDWNAAQSYIAKFGVAEK